MKRILVTGPLGHIGSQLIRFLPSVFPGAHIVLLDNLSTQRYCSLFNLSGNATYEFHEMDAIDPGAKEYIAGCDVVVHLAGMTDATGSLKHPELIAKNLEATINIANHCAEFKIPILYSSSTSVYGTQREVVDETCGEEDLKPQSPYAEYKIKEEKYLQELGRNSKLPFTICRFGTICGVSPGMRFHTAVNKFCYQAVLRQPITVWRTAYEQRRPYLELGDACRAVAHIINAQLFNGQLFNIVSENTTVKAIIDAIRIKIPNVQIEYVDSAIMNQLSYTVSSAKFEATNFKFSGSLKDAIAATIATLKGANS